MALRKEVFQSKVLHKLYPAASRLEKESTATPNVSALTKKTIVKRSIQGESNIGNTSTAAKRIYTVVPPPADYKADSEKSVTHSEPENLQSVAEPDENTGDGSSNEQAKESEEKKKRRRRKKRKDVALNQTAGNEGEERLSKNKKRKLKKKRHKEKLLSMGLVPRAAAVEFTYQRDRLRSVEDAKEEEEGSRQRDEPVQEQEGNP